MRGSILAAVLALGLGLPCAPALADSSSPLLAAYYDRFMALSSGFTYTWVGDGAPSGVGKNVRQVDVGRGKYYALTNDGVLWGSRRIGAHGEMLGDVLMRDVTRFSAGRTGVLAIRNDGGLWWRAADAAVAQKIADDVVHAAVGDSANYYVTSSGALFVTGLVHRGQYGDGRLKATDTFVQTASGVARVHAHTGHALILLRNGDVMGTGGNIYGPVGRHGLGDKAVRWGRILSGARAIATGSSHSLAIRRDGTLVAWGAGYGPDPVAVMENVSAVAAGSSSTIVLMRDEALWQWGRNPSERRKLTLR
jgi:alpha-tubulin suppressor-like RCC1 family protein